MNANEQPAAEPTTDPKAIAKSAWAAWLKKPTKANETALLAAMENHKKAVIAALTKEYS